MATRAEPMDSEVLDGGALAMFLACQDNPSLFVRNVIGAEPEHEQDKILQAVRTNKYIAAHTGHGVGKTTVGSWLVLWFMFTREEAKVISTAPTWRQVKDLLWTEIAKWEHRMDLSKIGWVYPYELLNTRLTIRPEWFATGESSDDPFKLEGYHAPHIMYIIDEAKAVPDTHFDAMDGGMTTLEAKQVLLSTPGPTSGKLYKVCSGRENVALKRENAPEEDLWKIIHVNAEDSDNVDSRYIAGRRAVWGARSATYRMRVKGEFVDVADDTLVTPAEIEACQELELPPVKDGVKEARVVAIDVARYGSDRSVIAMREGNHVFDFHKYDQMDTIELAEAVYADVITDFKPDEVWVDTTGVGAGVYDWLKRQPRMENRCFEFIAGAKPFDEEMYLNRRAEVFHGILREKIKEKKIKLPMDEVMEGQLPSLKFEFRPKGQFTVVKMKSKEEMRRGGEESPDEGDALAMLFAGDDENPNAPGQGVWF